MALPLSLILVRFRSMTIRLQVSVKFVSICAIVVISMLMRTYMKRP